MRKKIVPFFLVLCLLAGCGRSSPDEPIACASKEDCFLCAGVWGQNNIAIISLNTFEKFNVEINRYDAGGKLIEEEAGRIHIRGQQPSEDGFYVFATENPDRGYADLTVTLGSDETADRNAAAGFLCEGCLEKVLPKGGREKVGIGAIDLATGEIKVFDRQMLSFTLGDFYVHCDWEKQEPTLKLLIFCCPPRY